MSNNKKDSQKIKIKSDTYRLQVIMIGIVVPILFSVALLGYFGFIDIGIEPESKNPKTNFDAFIEFYEEGKDATVIFTDGNGNIITSNLFDQQKPFIKEVKTVVELLSDIDLQCYNVDLYDGGNTIIYIPTLIKIDEKLEKHNRIQFYNNFIVEKYMEVTCPHIINQKPPPSFSNNIGIDPLVACKETNQPQRYCDALIKLMINFKA